MKKLMRSLLVATATMLSLGIQAQDKAVAVKSASCTQAQSSNPVSYAYDGNTSTFWHTPWGGTTTSFPVTITFTLNENSHVDYARYICRQDGNTNGNWKQVAVSYSTTTSGSDFVTVGTFDCGSSSADLDFGTDGIDDVRRVRFTIQSGQGNFASCAEMQFYIRDNSKLEAFKPYFDDPICTQLKAGITSSADIQDADVKTLVDNLLKDATAYKKFRVGEYRAYRTTASLRNELRTSAQYTQYENPTGIYATEGKPMIVFVDGIGSDPVKLTVKNWLLNERESAYALRNGINFITPTTTGNTFVTYYTDEFQTAPKVRVHIVNGQVQGYYNQQTMTNADWKEIMALHPSDKDSTIIICQSQHAQTAYPAFIWRRNALNDIDSVMTLYQQVQWAERDIMGLTKYGRECDNRQLFFATNYGFMAAGGTGAYCHVGSLNAITKPDSKNFDFWGVGHEWGHNNQIQPGFKWSGCGETTNNIYASWAQIHFTGNPANLRLEDERTGVNDYSGTRGGRMQTYFEEGLRKGVQWQLQDGPDYHGAAESGTNNSRNYDHFVKLVPFWQMNLWGTLAGKCPDIIPMVIESIRNTPSSTLSAMNNGQQQVNIMKLACDSAKIDLLPFFEKAGMLKPINKYIEDYGPGWNIITEEMINNLKEHVAQKGYPAFTEEINYINGHNYHIYRDNLKLSTPEKLGEGCALSGSRVKVLHAKVQNAVAYETYNSDDELVRITMYGLNADDAHSYTEVLYPAAEDAAYIMAVGYDGTRAKIFEQVSPKFKTKTFYTLLSSGKGGYLTSENCTVNASGNITWSIARATSVSNTKCGHIWAAEERNGKMYLFNPQSQSYLGGTDNKEFSQYCTQEDAPYFLASAVNTTQNTWAFAKNGSGQYLNSYSATATGYWSGGTSDANNIWKVEEVETINVSIPATGYRAICYPFGLEIPDGVKAYYAKSIAQKDGQSYVILTEITDSYIPSYTPAIVVKEGITATTNVPMNLFYDYDLEHAEQTSVLTGALLKQSGFKAGALLGLSKDKDSGITGFYANTSTTMTSNYAYILATDAQGITSLPLITEEEFTTGIGSVRPTASASSLIYDLTGRTTSATDPGIYVKNGKKVLVK
ncbi:MAG: M60 family metallopeptidase [Bacteroidales bacterium]|nr:M60 family metallopeptidase [Candidatus Physcousia equi]